MSTITITSEAQKLELIKMIANAEVGQTISLEVEETPTEVQQEVVETTESEHIEVKDRSRVLGKIVMVDDINNPNNLQPTLNEGELLWLAQSIINMQGASTIRPILIEKGIDNYDLYSGANIYHAAVKAQQLDPLKGETINVILAKSEQEAEYLQSQMNMIANH